ncbi:hypothetical protein [Hyphomicrobium sp. DY-1]
MKPYVRGDGDPMEIREEILDIAATQEMSASKGFNARKFFRRAGKIIRH